MKSQGSYDQLDPASNIPLRRELHRESELALARGVARGVVRGRWLMLATLWQASHRGVIDCHYTCRE